MGDPTSIPESEDPMEKGMATHSNILAWKIPQTEATPHGVAKNQTRLNNDTVGSFSDACLADALVIFLCCFPFFPSSHRRSNVALCKNAS